MRELLVSAGVLAAASISIFAYAHSQTNLNSYTKINTVHDNVSMVENFFLDRQQYIVYPDHNPTPGVPQAVRTYKHTPGANQEFALDQVLIPADNNPNKAEPLYVDFFTSKSGSYLMVGHTAGDSSLYKWDVGTAQFVYHSAINQAYEHTNNLNMKVFSEGDNTFAAFIYDVQYQTEFEIAIYQEQDGRWTERQIIHLPSDSGYPSESPMEFLSVDGNIFLLVALDVNSSADQKGIYSYRWEGTQFVYDSKYDDAALVFDLKAFQYNNETYVAAVGGVCGYSTNVLLKWKNNALEKLADIPTCSDQINVIENARELYFIPTGADFSTNTNQVMRVNMSEEVSKAPTFENLYFLTVDDKPFANNDSTAYVLDGVNYILEASGFSLGDVIRVFKFNSSSEKK